MLRPLMECSDHTLANYGMLRPAILLFLFLRPKFAPAMLRPLAGASAPSFRFCLDLGHCVPVYFLLNISGSWKAISLRYSTFVALHRFCRKARKSVFAMCIWRLSSIFDLGLCVFDRPIRIQHFTPCARAVHRQALGTRLKEVPH